MPNNEGYDDSWMSPALKASDAIALHVVDAGPAEGGLSEEEARAWLAQPVPPRAAGRTISTEEVSSA